MDTGGMMLTKEHIESLMNTTIITIAAMLDHHYTNDDLEFYFAMWLGLKKMLDAEEADGIPE